MFLFFLTFRTYTDDLHQRLYKHNGKTRTENYNLNVFYTDNEYENKHADISVLANAATFWWNVKLNSRNVTSIEKQQTINEMAK